MRGEFDDREPEARGLRRDTELTLGSGALLALFAGLVLLCGLCFGLGYTVGHHGSQEPVAAAQSPSGAQAASQQDSSRPKPPATGQAGVAAAPQSAAPDQPADAANDSPAPAATNTSAAPASQSAASASNPTAAASQPQMRSAQVQPAILPTPKPLQSVQSATVPSSPPRPQSAAAPAIPLMVQIAAVSHVEDASVLVNALRKRGYTVTAQRKPDDGLIHVWIGPFNNRDEANKWRLKLLDDGYNAIVQP